MLEYLRTGRKLLPKNVSNYIKEQTEFEFEELKVTKLRYDLAKSAKLQKVEKILDTTPKMYQNTSKAGLDNWKKLGPLSIQQVIDKSGINPEDYDNEDNEVKKHKSGNYYTEGMHI